MSHSRVLPPALRNDAAAWTVLVRLIEKVAARLRHDEYWAESLGMSINFLKSSSWHQHLRMNPCQDTSTLIHTARQLWQSKPAGIPLRVGVVLSNLVTNRNATVPLFPEDQKLLALSLAMDGINQKHGAEAVYFAEAHDARGEVTTRIAFTRIPDLSLPDA